MNNVININSTANSREISSTNMEMKCYGRYLIKLNGTFFFSSRLWTRMANTRISLSYRLSTKVLSKIHDVDDNIICIGKIKYYSKQAIVNIINSTTDIDERNWLMASFKKNYNTLLTQKNVKQFICNFLSNLPNWDIPTQSMISFALNRHKKIPTNTNTNYKPHTTINERIENIILDQLNNMKKKIEEDLTTTCDDIKQQYSKSFKEILTGVLKDIENVDIENHSGTPKAS